jgi:hypothetical protein
VGALGPRHLADTTVRQNVLTVCVSTLPTSQHNNDFSSQTSVHTILGRTIAATRVTLIDVGGMMTTEETTGRGIEITSGIAIATTTAEGTTIGGTNGA